MSEATVWNAATDRDRRTTPRRAALRREADLVGSRDELVGMYLSVAQNAHDRLQRTVERALEDEVRRIQAETRRLLVAVAALASVAGATLGGAVAWVLLKTTTGT